MQVKRQAHILFLLCISAFYATAQSSNSLEAALFEIASSHELSIIFTPSSLPEISVPRVNTSWSVEQKLSAVLRKTKLEFRIENEEIILFYRRAIYGFIEDRRSGERLIAATLYIPESGNYTVANEQGYFSLSTIEDSLTIVASYLGYAKEKIKITAEQMDRPFTIRMSLDNTIDEIVITDALFSASSPDLLELEKGTNVMLYQNSASTAVGGEPDLFQAIFRQTGVTTGVDGVGGIHVRGGKSGHNQVLLDGMKLHFPNHAFGLYSIINNSIVERANLNKAGSAGIYSGSSASILDVKSTNPTLRSFKTYAQVSSIASQAGVNIPLGKKVALHAIARTTHLDPIVQQLTEDAKSFNDNIGFSNLFFNDINAKLKYDARDRLKLYASYFSSRDGYIDTNKFLAFSTDDQGNGYEGVVSQEANYTWRNSMLQFRGDYILSRKSFLSASLSSYRYGYFSSFSQDFIGWNYEEGLTFYEKDKVEFFSGLTSFQGRLDFETNLKKSKVLYGLQLLQREYNLGLYSLDIIGENENPYEPLPERELEDFFIGDRLATEATVYYVHNWRASSKLVIEGAFYYTYLYSRDKEDDFFTYNPDLLLNFGGVHGYGKALYKWNDRLLTGFNIGTSLQTEHLLSPADNSYPNDIWIPATPFVRPQRTYQVELFTRVKTSNHSLSLSTYAKRTLGVSLISSFPPILTLSEFLSDEWEQDILVGRLNGYGVELSYGYQGKNWDILANYSYTYADYVFSELNSGDPFSYDYSIPHTLSLRSQVRLSKRWTSSMDWYIANGKPFTLYRSYFRYQPLDRGIEFEVEPLSGYNDFRLPNNHKLSISLSTWWNWGKVRNDLSFGIQNVYNRQNSIYQYSLDGKIEDFIGFPILPMIKYRISI